MLTKTTSTLFLIRGAGLAAVVLAGSALIGCDLSTRPNPTQPAPDNTANNAKSRDGAQSTPMDQSQSSSDVSITAEVRRSLMADETLSTNAKNCKIITDKGAITLEGVVDSTAERDLVETRAKAVPGVVSVLNRLEAKTR